MSDREHRKFEEEQLLVDQHNWRLSFTIRVARHCVESGHRFYIVRDDKPLQQATAEDVIRFLPLEPFSQLKYYGKEYECALLFAPINRFMKCLTYGWLVRWNEDTDFCDLKEIKGNTSLPILARDPSWFSGPSKNDSFQSRKGTEFPVQEIHVGRMSDPGGFKPIKCDMFEHVVLTSHIRLGLLAWSN